MNKFQNQFNTILLQFISVPVLLIIRQNQYVMWLSFNLIILIINQKGQIVMQKTEPMFTLSKPKWSWVKIDSELKTKYEGKSFKLSLKPTVTFQQNWPSMGNEKISQKIIIDTEKSLQYENEVGWNWHKSSNLPIISIKLEVKQQESENLLPLPDNLQAKLFAVKIIVNALERNQIAFLEDVGIRGNSRIQLKDGCGFFSGIRFLSTSYNNEGVKFYLLIVIYSKTEGSKIEDIICSVLSPPIFVDSRKSARDYQEKRFLSFVELFEPGLFNKDFIKRENKTKPEAITKITNSLEGLFNYLTAPNIRHKVKHPLFLSNKFSNAFKILYNENYFENKDLNVAEIIKKLQRKLIKDIGGEKKNKKILNKNSHKPFIISLQGQCNAHKKSKIFQCLEYLDCRAIELVQYPYQIPQNHRDIATLGDVVEAYTQNYGSLLKISNKDISARKTRQEQAVEMSARDQLADSDEDDEKLKNQCKEEFLYRSKSMMEKNSEPSENDRLSFTSSFTRRYIPKCRRPKVEEHHPFEIGKKRIDNNLNPIGLNKGFEPIIPEVNKDIHLNPHFLTSETPMVKLQKDHFPNKMNDIPHIMKEGQNFEEEISFNPQPPLDMLNKVFQPPMIRVNPIIGAPTIPLKIQSLEMSQKKFMENMDRLNPNVSPSFIKFEKEHLKNEILSQIQLQNSFLQQIIIDNEMMKSKVQMLFEYAFIEEHHNSQSEKVDGQILQANSGFLKQNAREQEQIGEEFDNLGGEK